ncbi:uncharacterized protein LOC133724763 isoform X2 [Rosa rugosa]|uniref:uncharacterized protein LOC133724763 isoform X2 n=1 Tax=Rosa rugosa TaxID=74645 RepID=UPI002B40E052|nr:uncharacterized protein LOC133724763 isoform X2 [Rosa rugosa]
MKMKPETVTLVLVNLASIMQRADESLLPGVYKEVGASLHTDPTGLGSLTLFRSIVQSSCYPLAAYLAMRHNRAHVIALGAFLWAAATFLVGFSSTFLQNNGRAKDEMPHTFSEEVKDLIKESKSVIKIPTFQILIAQGVFGSFPWSGLSFAPLWLELIGFSHKETAVLWTIFIIGASLGSLFGGKMGDVLAKPFPNAGRIVLSQISAGSAIPFAALLLLGLPDDPSTGFMHGLVLFIMGWFTSWNAPATNNPIFAEIVPERSRTSIYALDQSFESILSSFAPPIVGILVQHVFGYKPIPKGSSDSVEIETDRENAAALAKALFTTMAIPMTLCVSIYSFLYCTYPRDRERARMQALIESEMQHLETSCAASGEEYSQLNVSESKVLNGKDESDIDVEYAAHESVELDDNDEKSLLSHQLTFSNMKE